MAIDPAESATKQATTALEPQFTIQRIYVKDLSFEAPTTPHLFREEWKPQVDLALNTTSTNLENAVYEVVLTVTVTAKTEKNTAFLIEVHQAGIFTLQGFTNEQQGHMIHAFCPNILFPYAREVVSDLLNRGGFPALYLAPINFDAIYQQQQQQEKASAPETVA